MCTVAVVIGHIHAVATPVEPFTIEDVNRWLQEEKRQFTSSTSSTYILLKNVIQNLPRYLLISNVSCRVA